MSRKSRAGNCSLCGIYRERLERDHIYPRWKCRRDGWTKEQIEDPSNIQYICSNCHRDKTSSERPEISTEQRIAISILHTGRKASEETRRKISLAHKGRKHTPEQIEKIRQSNRGKINSIETRLKISQSKKAQNLHLSEEHKQRLREANTGKKHNAEFCEKVSLANRARYGKLRAEGKEIIGCKWSEESKEIHKAAIARRFEALGPMGGVNQVGYHWKVSRTIDYKLAYLGTFNSLEEALEGKRLFEIKLKNQEIPVGDYFTKTDIADLIKYREDNSVTECDLAKVEVVGSSSIPHSTLFEGTVC
jgi:hypothetical protein